MTRRARHSDSESRDGRRPASEHRSAPRSSAPVLRVPRRSPRAAHAAAVPLLDASEARFLGTAAHELRGAVGRVTLMAEALALEAGDDADAPLLRRIERLAEEGRRMQALAGQLLEVTAINEARRLGAPEAVPLRALVVRVVEDLSVPPAVTIDVRLGEDLVVFADPVAIAQVVENLLANALRHGGGSVMVTGAGSDGTVVLTVADDGPGIPPALRSHVFEPFARGPGGGHSPGASGAGLGLYIVAEVLDLLGGSIAYEDNHPQGACFRVVLPAGHGPATTDGGVMAPYREDFS
jgi:signal transduction histidine kinase